MYGLTPRTRNGQTMELAMAANGHDALQMLDTFVPDVILLDLMMPQMDGTELVEKIRSHPRLNRLPAIALTAHAMRGDREKHLSHGFDDYVTKPIEDEKILLGAIERALAKGGDNASRG